MRIWEEIIDAIDDRIPSWLGKNRRLGFFRAVGSAAQSLRRVDLDADFGIPFRKVQRISSPLLDVIPAAGTPLAVLARHGVPEFPAYVGAIWDDVQTAGGMTAWLRANLEEHAGYVELGAENGVRIVVESNGGDITPVDADTIELEASTVFTKGGTVYLGVNADTLGEALLKSDTFITALVTLFDSHVNLDPITGVTGTPQVPWATVQAATLDLAKSSVSSTE